MQRGGVFIISAPSGAGKSTLIARLRSAVEGLGFSVSHTTRAPRPGEQDGREYHFVDTPRFRELIEQGAFAEWAEVHDNLYGTSFAALEAERDAGRDVILDIDVQGALQLAERLDDAVSLFILPPSLAELERRLTHRGDANDTLQTRLRNAQGELKHASGYDYCIINDDIERATADLVAIVKAERCRAQRSTELLDHLAPRADR